MRWALVVLVTLVLVGVWVLAFLMPDLRWFAEVLTCVVLAAAVLVLVIPLTRERMKRAQADRAEREGKGREQRGKRAELADLRVATSQGLRRARAHEAGQHRDAKASVVPGDRGTQGAGRTTMLERLGLSLVPVLESGGRPGPERPAAACDLWCSQDAVVVDVKAPSGDEDAARDVWLLVLDEVRRLRPRRPIEGCSRP